MIAEVFKINNCIFFAYFILLFMLISLSVVANDWVDHRQVDDDVINGQEAINFELKALTVVDEVHGSVSDNIIFVSNYIDNFFSNERMDDEGSKSKVLLSYAVGYDDFSGVSKDYTLRARLHFPRTQERLRLIVDSQDDDQKGLAADPRAQAATESRIEGLKAAFQYVFVRSRLWQVSANTGVKISLPLNPFVRLRVRRLFLTDYFTYRIAQSVFLFRTEGLGQTTSFDIERSLNALYFFRSSSRLTSIKNTNEQSFSHSFSIYRDFGNKKRMVYAVGANADINLPVTIKRYYLDVRYRHNFYKKWAFYELVPGFSWERENNFGMSPGFFVKLDIIFG